MRNLEVIDVPAEKIKPFVRVCVTTYTDLDRRELARAVWKALEETSPKLLPEKAGYLVKPTASATTEADFLAIWDMDRNLYVQENCDAPRQRTVACGVRWTRSSAIKSEAEFSHFGPKVYDNTLSLKAEWRKAIDWKGLFDKLCTIMSPSYAMMHLYSGAEAVKPGASDMAFPGAFWSGIKGEYSLSAVKGYDGRFRRVDSFDAKARRTYRTMPDLPWANCFGRELDGQYSREALVLAASNVREEDGRLTFTITSSMADVIDEPEAFADARTRLKSCFEEGFFR